LAGRSPAEVAQQFGKTINWVRLACKQHGVPVPSTKTTRLGLSSYQIIAALCNSTDTLSSIANSLSLTEQTISGVFRKCQEAGIPVHPRTAGRPKLEGEPKCENCSCIPEQAVQDV